MMLVHKIWFHKDDVELTAELMEQAERLWIIKLQQELFGSEIVSLMKGEPLKSSKLSKLSVFLGEDGILRIKGISEAEGIPQHTKTPIILEGSHRYTKLLIKQFHERLTHGSSEVIINELRQKYWIIKIRPVIKSVTLRCQHYRVRKAEPEIPEMGDLPRARISHHKRPFTLSGIDYFSH